MIRGAALEISLTSYLERTMNKVLTILHLGEDERSIAHMPVIGDRTLSLLKSIRVSDTSKDTIVSEAADVLSHCVFKGETGSRTNIAVGYVQSGKTLSYTVLSALAADNGFKVVIYLTGTKTNLQNQTYDRLEKDFDLENNYTNYKLFEDNLQNDAGTINRIVNFLNIEGCVLLFPILKHYQHIGVLASLFQSTSIKSRISHEPVLIIDDEADQSSFNTYAKKNSAKKEWEPDEFSATYSSILDLRKAFPCHSYIQYTATPQAAFLIDSSDILSPEYHTVLTPGEGYIGGKYFFKNPEAKLIEMIPEDEVYHYKRNPLQKMPNSLLESLKQFLLSVAVVVFIQKRERYLSMMIHVDGTCASNTKFYKWTTNTIQGWIETLELSTADIGRLQLVKELQLSYDEITKHIQNRPNFEKVLEILPLAMKLTHIRLIHGDNKKQEQTDSSRIKWEQDKAHILVGAEMLNRGFTIEKLSMTYMPRTAKGKATADTIEQRCRFFGYKENYKDVCRLFLSSKAKEEYEAYVEHEEILRTNLKQCNTMSEFSKKYKAMVLSNKLAPTRSNILSKKLVVGKMVGWHSLLSVDSFEENYKLTRNMLDGVPYADFEYFDRFGDNVSRNHRYVKVSVEACIDFLRQFKYHDVPNITRKIVSIQYLRYLEETAMIKYVYLIEMAYEADGNQMRSHKLRDGKPINLMVGHSPNYDYPGDSFFRFEDSICIQLHGFRINDPGMMGNKKVYNLAFYYPESLGQHYVTLNDNDGEEVDDDV